MSYCRFSTDDYQCDVYVYHDVDGHWITHVAGSRVVYASPLPETVSFVAEPGDWMKRHDVVMGMLDKATSVGIDLEFAGESFTDSAPFDCAVRLGHLRNLGYQVPESAIAALLEEQAEQAENDDHLALKMWAKRTRFQSGDDANSVWEKCEIMNPNVDPSSPQFIDLIRAERLSRP